MTFAEMPLDSRTAGIDPGFILRNWAHVDVYARLRRLTANPPSSDSDTAAASDHPAA